METAEEHVDEVRDELAARRVRRRLFRRHSSSVNCEEMQNESVDSTAAPCLVHNTDCQLWQMLDLHVDEI